MATAAALCLMAVIAGCASLPQGQFWGNRWDNGWDNNQWDAPPWWMNDPTPFQPPQGRPRPTTTPAPITTATPTTPSPVDSFGRVPGCDCPAPPQYNPVCGSDGNTYNNPQLLECANRCGHRVTISFVGLCVAGK